MADPAEPIGDRVARAAASGIRGVEVWSWRTRLDALERALAEHGATLVSMTVEPMVPLVDASLAADFRVAARASIEAARRLGCETLVVVAGQALPDVARSAQRAAIVAALRDAAARAEDAGVVLALENLNSRVDHPGTFLDSTEEALDIVDEVGSPGLRLLYDLYHSVTMGEDPATVLRGRIDRVRHVQVADVPGRHEPGTGRIDWRATLGRLRSDGYRGWLGLEYAPSGDSADSLAFVRSLVSRDAADRERAGIIAVRAPVAQWIERRPPEPKVAGSKSCRARHCNLFGQRQRHPCA